MYTAEQKGGKAKLGHRTRYLCVSRGPYTNNSFTTGLVPLSDNIHIMLVGGCSLASPDYLAETITQFFNTQSKVWSNGPNLKTARCRSRTGCAISHMSSPYLYVFGGATQFSTSDLTFFSQILINHEKKIPNIDLNGCKTATLLRLCDLTWLFPFFLI